MRGMKFAEKLRKSWEKSDSLVCVGLDVNTALLPSSLTGENGVLAFNEAIIQSTADLVCAYKMNTAFYEAMGPRGLEILQKTLSLIPSNIVKIIDAKRGDTENTGRAYAKALFDVLGGDAVTLHPYMGRDSLSPFLEREEKGAFVLCRTSNTGARDFQDLGGHEPLYITVAKKVKEWNVHENCGLVVGATYPKELGHVRETVGGDMPLLVPGIGAQGGSIEEVIKNGLNEEGTGLIINSSRGIIFASRGKDFASAARKKTLELKEAINTLR